jgi:hypothetical protein
MRSETEAATTKPRRIQRKRTKGWRMPEGAIYVGRPSKWGNPFVAHDWRASFRAVFLGCRGDQAGRNEAAVKLYRLCLTADLRPIDLDDRSFMEREVLTVRPKFLPPALAEVRRELRGKDLVCWCPLDRPCHADVLLELANAE